MMPIEAMYVWGAPQVQLRLGGLDRVAQYKGRSGCETLRFTYVVTEEDVLEISLNAADVSVEQLRLNIEVGDLLLKGAEIQPGSGRHFGDPTTVDERRPVHIHATREYRHLLRERAGFRVKVDVNLDELEHVDDLVCH